MKRTIKSPIGEIEYETENRITLPRGIPGFEDVRHAVWVSDPEFDPIKWFILEENVGEALPLLDPFLVVDRYEMSIPDDAFETLESDTSEDLALMCVAHPRENAAPTINLRSPIIINPNKRLALQVILPDESLPIRYDWSKNGTEVKTG
ncbi:MAG: flagellar assembly protein FliW [Candidatus Marinimicrobia bacterium]|nr:flagellar assembly protein FliW [Candidatus Neomarinimicrobiota bacterium]MCF7880538.1 flagellar assembly protein FliW [Candidatus Neomarinimicrobiota bacterium]